MSIQEVEHNFSADWQSDAFEHWHACQNEGCSATDETAEHENKNSDSKCDICSYEFGYVYDPDTESYMVDTYDGLLTVLALGGNIVLVDDIELTEYIVVTKDAALDLNGKAITIVDGSYSARFIIQKGTMTVMDNQGGGKIGGNTDQVFDVKLDGALVINGGSIKSNGYTLYVDGAVTVNGGTISYLCGADNYGVCSVTITGGTILEFDLVGVSTITITGGTFGDNPSEYLSSEYVAIYNETDGLWTVVPANNEQG